MRKMEEILNKPYRDHGAYRVPEGYFDSLNRRVMDALPDGERQTPRGLRLWLTTKARYAAAACIAAAAMLAGTAVYYAHDGAEQETVTAAIQQETMTDDYVQECMDYAMVDGNDLYSYLSEQ
ncbi:MAG: hypothetical protein Q4E63_07710 [Prevotellaceae bacterium]|nr:hypothetical protein [Prevotellaceae bacterium]MDO4932511.1 hypothetical protein [Prevotellaceae bacterium]